MFVTLKKQDMLTKINNKLISTTIQISLITNNQEMLRKINKKFFMTMKTYNTPSQGMGSKILLL